MLGRGGGTSSICSKALEAWGEGGGQGDAQAPGHIRHCGPCQGVYTLFQDQWEARVGPKPERQQTQLAFTSSLQEADWMGST